MILGFHLVFCAYGFWLPNDPRGSWSTYVGSRPLRQFGPATKTSTRRSVASHMHNHALRQQAKTAMQLPPILFTGLQAREIAKGFQKALTESHYTTHACSILPDHAHLVLTWHPHEARQIIGHLKGRATQALAAANLHPFADLPEPHTPWAEGGWAVYLFDDADMRRAIQYVENNPLKENKPRQHWSFVTPYPSSAPRHASMPAN
ncbi:MAG: transposase [Phycisphaerales bacterium]|nr:transposase [Phycisphaerales bacterium]